MSGQLTLIDGNNLLFRAYYGVHSRLTKRDGKPVNAVFGFCNMMLPLLAKSGPDDVFICVFDAHRRNWRNDIYPDYKANRSDTPADLLAQVEPTREAAAAMGMTVLVIDNVEADDVIATLTKHECAVDKQTRIISGDKDLMQLVSHCCFLYDTMKEVEIREPEVMEKFGVKPNRVVDVQSLMGDATDNVPGVPGIGPKTASELIQKFGSLDGLYRRVNEVERDRIRNLLVDNKDKAYISQKLVSLKSDVKLPHISREPYRMDTARAIEFIRDRLESPSLEAKVNKLFGDTGFVPPSLRGAVAQSATGRSSPSSALPTLPLKEGETKHLPYKLITTEPELDEFIAGIGDVLAIDTETTGLDQMTARAVGISLATSPHHGVYIPLRHTKKSESLFDDDSASHVQLDINIVREKLWPILKNKNIIKVGHNLKYDFHVLENEGWATDEIAPYDDTMLLSYVLFGTSHGHGLDELAEIYLAHDTIKFGALFPPKMKDADKNFAHIDLQSAAEYAAEDAWITFALYKKFREKLEHNETLHKLYENCDRPLMRVLLHMERIGVMADQSRLASLSEIFHKQLATLQKEIWHLAGREFNIASPKQLGELLYDELKLPGGGKSKSTDAATLAEISSEHPVVAKVLEWRSVAKLAGTYADALPRQIASDGRIHTTYLQTSTNTGRLSSRDPNLQNIPIKSELGMEIRKCFVAPRGRTLIALDYSQIQLRLLAHFADVKELKESFAHGRDIHEDTARKIYGIAPGGHVTHAQRAVAKTTNFSIIYGVSPFGLAAQLDIPVGDAKQLIDSYMAGFPEIETYMKNTKEFGAAHGYVMTPWGRRIELPDVKNPRSRSYALRAAINAPIQGFEADLMRFAMVKIDEMIRGEQIKMILQVHDEIVFECDEDSAEDWAQKIEHVMESVTKLSVPIVADYSISKDWKK